MTASAVKSPTPSKLFGFTGCVWLTCCILSSAACDRREDGQSRESRAEKIEELAFPSPSPSTVHGNELGLMKWQNSVQFVVLAERKQDEELAVKAIESIVAGLPTNLRNEVTTVADGSMTGNWYQHKAIIFVGPDPYATLRGQLLDVFRYLSIGDASIDQEIRDLGQSGSPAQNKLLAGETGEVLGFLSVIDSDLTDEEKKLRLSASVTFALSPSLLFIQNDPGLYEWNGQEISLSKLGEDYFTILLDKDARAGMSREEFSKLVRSTL